MQKLFRLLQTDNSGINPFSLLIYICIITAMFFIEVSVVRIKRFYFYFFFRLTLQVTKSLRIFYTKEMKKYNHYYNSAILQLHVSN